MAEWYRIFLSRSGPVHMVGIGGIGMSGIARILVRMGVRVQGSDAQESPIVEGLRSLGVRVSIGHSKRHLEGCSLVVVSSAIRPSNPEYREAVGRGIPLLHRADVLGDLMRFRTGIAISGTHGKTTTTAMLSTLLMEAGMDPTFVIGAVVEGLGSNSRHGDGSLMVCEADESDRSFLKLPALCKIVTNIDLDHMDEYRDEADLEDAFERFMNDTPFFGQVIACKDDSRLRRVLKKVHRPVISYGLDCSADVSASLTGEGAFRATYDCFYHGQPLGSVELGVPGRHNVLNSLAAVAAGLWLELPFQVISDGLSGFRGAERRQQLKGRTKGVTVVDDYAHHPSEIRETLAALRWKSPPEDVNEEPERTRRMIAVYQPHRFSRTQHLLDSMQDCFEAADRLFVLPVYPAGEDPIPGVDSGALVERIGVPRNVTLLEDAREAVEMLRRESRPGDMVVTLGAGDVWKVGEAFLAQDGD